VRVRAESLLCTGHALSALSAAAAGMANCGCEVKNGLCKFSLHTGEVCPSKVNKAGKRCLACFFQAETMDVARSAAARERELKKKRERASPGCVPPPTRRKQLQRLNATVGERVAAAAVTAPLPPFLRGGAEPVRAWHLDAAAVADVTASQRLSPRADFLKPRGFVFPAGEELVCLRTYGSGTQPECGFNALFGTPGPAGLRRLGGRAEAATLLDGQRVLSALFPYMHQLFRTPLPARVKPDLPGNKFSETAVRAVRARHMIKMEKAAAELVFGSAAARAAAAALGDDKTAVEAWLQSDAVWAFYLAAFRREDYQLHEGEVSQLGFALGLSVTMFRAVGGQLVSVVTPDDCSQGKEHTREKQSLVVACRFPSALALCLLMPVPFSASLGATSDFFCFAAEASCQSTFCGPAGILSGRIGLRR
jgi:hypothetical protein